MKLFVPKEPRPGETRVAMIPEQVSKYVELGLDVQIESGLGDTIGRSDPDYQDAGAEIVTDRMAALRGADVVLRLNKPSVEEAALLKPGAFHVSYLDPFHDDGLISGLAEKGISAVAMEMIPRTTLAQKMDALSSQANLGGYVAVILAAERLDRILPMMMTPAGTIAPAKVFIIGAGVAGLQAIATAKRLGARVEAYDTRPVVREQVESLGARFAQIDVGETGQTKDGYAKALTDEQIARQRAGMAKFCANADIVITTAQVFGRKAPVIVTADMVKGMKRGSIIVDMAVETGGNVEGSKLNEEVDIGGVRIIGLGNLPGRVCADASLMYGSNLFHLVSHFWDTGQKALKFDMEEAITNGCLITHAGAIRHEQIKALIESKGDAS